VRDVKDMTGEKQVVADPTTYDKGTRGSGYVENDVTDPIWSLEDVCYAGELLTSKSLDPLSSSPFCTKVPPYDYQKSGSKTFQRSLCHRLPPGTLGLNKGKRVGS
jgi:hypothetical protein